RGKDGPLQIARGAVVGLLQAEVGDHFAEAFAILRDVDRIDAGADDRRPRILERLRQIQRRLAAELYDQSRRLDAIANVEHVLGGERLEEEMIAGVVISRDSLRI